MERRAEAHLHQNSRNNNTPSTRSLGTRIRTKLAALKQTHPQHPVFKLRTLFVAFWTMLVTYIILPPQHFIGYTRWEYIITSADDDNHRHLYLNAYRRQLAYLRHKGEGPLPVPSISPQSSSLLPRLMTIDSYIPSIVHSLRSWSAILACNYYHLRKIVLVNTFIINISLLLIKVCLLALNIVAISFKLFYGSLASYFAACFLQLLMPPRLVHKMKSKRCC